jgi:hypothetical protein
MNIITVERGEHECSLSCSCGLLHDKCWPHEVARHSEIHMHQAGHGSVRVEMIQTTLYPGVSIRD